MTTVRTRIVLLAAAAAVLGGGLLAWQAARPPAKSAANTVVAEAVPPAAPAEPVRVGKGETAPQQPLSAGGVVVFVDPATGKVREPDASEIGALGNAPAGRTAVSQAASRLAARPVRDVTIQGPGGAVGMRLAEDTMSYMVVTKTPDGKLDTDCLTGEKAAESAVAAGAAAKRKATGKSKEERNDR